MADCRVCEAAETSGEETLRTLVRVQALTIGRLRSNLDTFALAAAKARIRELEETVERVQRREPVKGAVEMAADLAEMDPRCNDDVMACFFCCQRGSHRRDCVWRRAGVVVEEHKRMERRKKAS